MPHASGPATRTRAYLFRFATDGEGGGSTLWPPLSDGSTPFAGTPVGVRRPLSRLYARVNRSPLVQTVELTSGSPLFFWGPTGRLRPRLLRGPSIRETTSTPTDITGTAVLSSQAATLVAAGQQDIFDIGNDTAYLSGQNATMSASAVNEVIGIGVLVGQNGSMLSLGSVFSGTDVVGTGILNAQEAALASAGIQEIIGQATLVGQPSAMSASGMSSFAPYTPDQVWQVLIEGQWQIIEALRVILAAVAGPSAGVGTNSVQYKSPITGQERVATDSTDGKNRSTVNIDGTT